MPELQPTAMLGNEIRYTELLDPKFRSCLLSIHLFTERTPENAPVCALLTDLLTATSRAYPTVSAMTLRLEELYAADVSASLYVCGDAAEIIVTAVWMEDAFALEGESVTDAVLELLLGCLFQPNAENGAFEEKNFRICKQNLLDDIACELNDKRGYAQRRAVEFAYQGEPAAIPANGTHETAEAVTPEEAFRVWQNILQTAPIDIVCVLPSEKPQIHARLTGAFGMLPRKPLPILLSAPSPLKDAPLTVTEEMPVAQSKLVLVFKYDNITDRDVLRMIHSLLGGTTGSLLFRNVREQRGLCYYCSARLSMPKTSLMIDCGVQTSQTAAAQQAILEQITALQNGDFTEEMMQESVLHLEYVLARVSDTAGRLANWVSTCRTLNEQRSAAEIAEAMRRVTKAQVMEAAKRLTLDTVYILRGTDDAADGGEEASET